MCLYSTTVKYAYIYEKTLDILTQPGDDKIQEAINIRKEENREKDGNCLS